MKQLMPFIMADQNKCTGCKACEVACHAWHHLRGKTAGTAIGPVLPKIFITRTIGGNVPVQCRQCEGAPCARTCTQGGVRFRDGRVWVDAAKCQSCPDCVLACPFGAIQLAPAQTPGATSGALKPRWFGNKCDLCWGREQGPVCVEACPEKALCLVEPLKAKREKNIKAARSIKDIYRNGR